ncbi:MAG TPA: hypothetical protein VFK80_04530, partial [Limnochordia bacterium]|nr:hypothetical protein [Limnochordia bacterium]
MTVFPHPEWHAPMGLIAAGGVILGVAGVIYFYLMAMTLFASPKLPAEETPSIPFAEALNEADDRASVRLFDKLGLWTAVALVLIMAAYGPVLVHLYQMYTPEIGFRAW